MITAEQAARALVAEARGWGIDPLKVFEPQHEAVRISAAVRCRPGPSSRTAMLARVFQIPNPVRDWSGAAT